MSNLKSSVRASDILINYNQTIVESAFEHTSLTSLCSNIMSSTEPNSFYLSRISALLLRAISLNKYTNIISGVVLQLLSFIYDYTIQDFFNELITNTKLYSKIQKNLSNSDFISIIISTIKSIEVPSFSNKNDQYTNKDISKLRNLYQLIIYFPKSKPLKKVFSIQANFSFIFDRMEIFPETVEQARWEALLSFYDKTTSKYYNPFLSQVIYFISEPYDSITPSRLTALSLLTKILQNEHRYALVLKDTDFCQVLLRLFAQFSENTFLHNQIFEFVSISLSIKDFREYIISSFVQPLISFCNETARNSYKSNTYNILCLFHQQIKKNKSLSDSIIDKTEFDNCINTIIDPYFDAIASKKGLV